MNVQAAPIPSTSPLYYTSSMYDVQFEAIQSEFDVYRALACVLFICAMFALWRFWMSHR